MSDGVLRSRTDLAGDDRPIREQLAALRTLYLVAFFGSLGIMVMTRDPVIVATWVAIWWLVSRMVGVVTPGAEVLLFWIAVSLLYPQISSAFGAMHQFGVVSGAVLLFCVVIFWPRVPVVRSRSRVVWIIVSAWIGWGAIAYAPVFLAWLWSALLRMPRPELLRGIVYYETTGLKVAIPVLTAALAALVPLICIVRRKDVDALVTFTCIASALFLFLSFAQWFAGSDLVPVVYAQHPGQMHGFSDPHPNGFGRRLLFPTLLACSASILGYGERRWWAPALCSAGVVAIILTQGRTSYLSFLTGFFVLMVLNARRNRSYLVASALVFGGLIVVLASGIVERFAPGGERVGMQNLIGRQVLQEKILSVVWANPWFGAHPGGYASGIIEAGYEGAYGSAHNMLLGIAAEWGVPLAAILLLTLAAGALIARGTIRAETRAGRRQWSSSTVIASQACIACAAAYCVHGITENVPPEQVFFLLGLAASTRNVAREGLGGGQLSTWLRDRAQRYPSVRKNAPQPISN